MAGAMPLLLALLIVLFSLPAQATMETGTVLAAQECLVQLGFLESTPDGIYGEQTEKAMERLRAYAQFVGEDLSDERLLGALIAGELPRFAEQSALGDVSETAMRVQRRLRVLSYLPDKADGRYGDNTERAVAVFQKALGMEPTGTADAATQERLFAADAPSAEYQVLAKGMKGERVQALQGQLAKLGFFTGLSDGQYGADTVKGVKAFQTYIQGSGHYDALEIKLRDAKVNGVADPLVLSLLFAQDFPVPEPMDQDAIGQDVYRVQRRLTALTYLEDKQDGGYGEDTAAAIAAFQERNGLKATGKANRNTIARLFSEEALEAVKPFKLTIDLSKQTLYVYKLSKSGAYDQLNYTMRCSTGPEIEPGEYAALTGPADAEWMKLGHVWARYPFSLDGVHIIHSVPYTAKKGDVMVDFLTGLGQPSQIGGVMVSVEDAKLIYEKCPRHTQVEIVP